MAKSNSELQLDIAKNLLLITQQMAAAVDAVNKKQIDQVQIMTQIQDAMKAMDTKGLIASVDAATKAINELTGKLSGLGKTSQQTLSGMSQQAQQAGTSVTSMSAAVTQAGQAATNTSNSTARLTTAVQDNKKSADKTAKTWSDFSKELKEKFPKSAVFASGALSGLVSGLKAIWAVSKFALSAFSQIVESIAAIGTAIISLPFDFLNFLTEKANKLASGSSEWFTAVQNVKKAFGDLQQTGSAALMSMVKNNQSLEGTGLRANRMWGTLAEQLNAFREMAEGLGPLFDNFAGEFKKTGKQLPSFMKGLGLTAEEFKGLAYQAKVTGTDITSVAITFTKQSLALSKQFGVSSKLISRDMAKALADVKHFGGATIKQIASASVYARKLGLELDKIVGTLDAFETFESAADNASKLSQAFGVQVDAFKMMEAQDPASQIDMLRKSFAAAGKDASTFNRQQLSLLASATGLDEATAKQAFSMKNQGVSLDQISKKSDEAEKRQIDQTKALRELAAAMDLVTKSGSSEGGFLDKFLQGVTQGFERTSEFRGLMRNMIGTFHVLRSEGRRLGRAIMESFPGVKTFFQGLKEIFDPKKFRQLSGGIVNELIKFFKEFMSGKYSFKQLMENITGPGGVFDKFMGAQGSAGQKVVEGFKTMWRFVTKLTTEAITWLSEKIASGIKYIGRLISGKEKLTDGGAGGFLAETLGPIWDALGDAWSNVSPVLLDLLENVGDKIGSWLKEKLLPMLGDIAPYVIGAIFGGAALKGLLSVAVAGFGKMLMTSLTGAVAAAAPAAAAAAAPALAAAAAPAAAAAAPALAAAAGAAGSSGPDLLSMLASEPNKEIEARKSANEKLHGAAKEAHAEKTKRMEDKLKESRLRTIAELDAKDQIAEAKKKMADVPEIPKGAPDNITNVAQSGDKVMDAEKKSKWGAAEAKELGKKMLALGAAILIGGVALALAILAIIKILEGKKLVDIAVALGVITAAVLLALPMMVALKLAAGIPKDDLVRGALTVTLGLLAMSGVAMAIAGLSTIIAKVEISTIGKMLLTMAGVVLLALPMLGVMFLASKIPKNGIIQGGLTMSAGVLAVALTALAVVGILGWLDPKKVSTAVKALDSVSLAFLMMIPILAAATIVGAFVTGTLGIGAYILLAGMATLAAGVLAVAATAVEVIEIISSAKIDPTGMQEKIDIFTKVMSSIQAIIGSIADFMRLMTPSVNEISSSDAFSKKVESANTFIKTLLGEKSSGTGIMGLVDVVMSAVEQLKTKDLGPAAEVFTNLMSTVPNIINALKPSDKFWEAAGAVTMGADDMAAVTAVANASFTSMRLDIEMLITGIRKELEVILALPMPNPESAKAVGALLQGLGQMLQSAMPDKGIIDKFTKDDKVDIRKLTDFLDASFRNLSQHLPRIAGLTLGTMAHAVKDLEPEKLTKLAVIGEILGSLSSLVGSLTSATKDIKVAEKVNLFGMQITLTRAATLGETLSMLEPLPRLMNRLVRGVKKVAEQMPTGKVGEDLEKQIKTVASLFNLLKVIPELGAAVGTASIIKVAGMEYTVASFDLAGPIERIIGVLEQFSKGDNNFLTRLMASVKDIYGKLTKYHQGVPLHKVAEKVTKFFTDLKSMSESLSALSEFGGQGSGGGAELGTGAMLKAPDPTLEEKIKTSMETLKNVLTNAIQPNVDGILDSLKTIDTSMQTVNPTKAVDKISNMVKSLSGLGSAFEELAGLGSTDPVTIRNKFGEINLSLGALAKAIVGDKAGGGGDFVGPPMPGVNLAELSATLADVDYTSLAKISTNVTRLTGHLSRMKRGFDSITGTINTEGLKSTMDAIIAAVGKVKELDDKLAEINAGKIQVATGLKTLATGLGIGGSSKLKVESKAVVIDLTVQVSMHAAEFERALVCRAESIIRERVNSTMSEPGTTFTGELPDSPQKAVPKVSKSGT